MELKDYKLGRKVKDLISNKIVKLYDLGASKPNWKTPKKENWDGVWLDDDSLNLYFRKFKDVEIID